MTVKKIISTVAIGFTLFLGLSFNSVLASSEIVPGGPWITDTQNVSLERLSSYPELVMKLQQIEQTSKGLVQLEVIGKSNQGRDIYLAKVGHPDKPAVMIITQQHGNEPMTTEAALKLLMFLSAGSNQAQAILDNLYVLVVARVNPDGAELFHRYNDDPTAPARNTTEGFYTSPTSGVGWDTNRYHWVTGWEESTLFQNHPLDYPTNPVPEAQAVIDAFNSYQPEWIADFHPRPDVLQLALGRLWRIAGHDDQMKAKVMAKVKSE